MPSTLQSPEKELRFTRSGQAVAFWISAAVCTAAAVTLLVTSTYRGENPKLPHAAWSILPLAAAALAARAAVRLTRHAYLILTPLGIEIFPFFRPAAGMRLISWQEIHSAELSPALDRLTLHHDAAKTSGIHIALGPIRRDRRTLLAKAITGRVPTPNH